MPQFESAKGIGTMNIMDFVKKSNGITLKHEAIPNNNVERDTDNQKKPAEPKEVKSFDLNIEKILENWEVYHAIREIISNALDEQTITGTQDISIYQTDDNVWHIVDYGRGLNYHHLTQNENEEKLNDNRLIGKFGVGLKDALATFYRHGIQVKIISKFGVITLKQSAKAGFEDITTLHAEITPPKNPTMAGTDFCLTGCSYEDIQKAENLFLKFSHSDILETTSYGQVIKKVGNTANIYINGVKVAEEPNFLFSYNITSLTAKLKKALNRERSNIGRTAYTDRVKSILLECQSDAVIHNLIDDLQQFGSGCKHDELDWQDVQIYASQQLKVLDSKSAFVTSDDLMQTPSIIDEMERSGYNPIVIPTNLANKMEDYNQEASDDDTFITTEQFVLNQQTEFNPVIVNKNAFTPVEKAVYSKTAQILDLIGGLPPQVQKIRIAESLYDSDFYYETVGLWQPEEHRILIKRKQLQSLQTYAGTLLHECIHAMSGFDDVSRDFEQELTKAIGNIAAKFLRDSK